MRVATALTSTALAVALAATALAATATRKSVMPTSPEAAVGPYSVVATYVLGGDGGWDCLSVDPAHDRLYISRGTHVMVVGTDSGKVVGDIPNTNGVHSIALATDLNKGFVTDGRDSCVTIFDLTSLSAQTTQPSTGSNPDASVYDPATKRVFAFDGRGQDATAIDAVSGKVVGHVPLGGKPEFGVVDGKGHGYVNLEDKSAIAEFDTRTLKVLRTFPLAPAEGPSGLAIDVEHKRLFAGCDNKMMAVVDLANGKVVATPAIGTGVDGTEYGPVTHLAFASCGGGDGTLAVIHEDDPDHYTVLQNVPTAARARTMALDPVSHRVYTVTAEFGPAPAPTADMPRPRPPMVPGTFKLLVLAPAAAK